MLSSSIADAEVPCSCGSKQANACYRTSCGYDFKSTVLRSASSLAADMGLVFAVEQNISAVALVGRSMPPHDPVRHKSVATS
jgi:hypothetical protein